LPHRIRDHKFFLAVRGPCFPTNNQWLALPKPNPGDVPFRTALKIPAFVDRADRSAPRRRRAPACFGGLSLQNCQTRHPGPASSSRRAETGPQTRQDREGPPHMTRAPLYHRIARRNRLKNSSSGGRHVFRPDIPDIIALKTIDVGWTRSRRVAPTTSLSAELRKVLAGRPQESAAEPALDAVRSGRNHIRCPRRHCRCADRGGKPRRVFVGNLLPHARARRG